MKSPVPSAEERGLTPTISCGLGLPVMSAVERRLFGFRPRTCHADSVEAAALTRPSVALCVLGQGWYPQLESLHGLARIVPVKP